MAKRCQRGLTTVVGLAAEAGRDGAGVGSQPDFGGRLAATVIAILPAFQALIGGLRYSTRTTTSPPPRSATRGDPASQVKASAGTGTMRPPA